MVMALTTTGSSKGFKNIRMLKSRFLMAGEILSSNPKVMKTPGMAQAKATTCLLALIIMLYKPMGIRVYLKEMLL